LLRVFARFLSCAVRRDAEYFHRRERQSFARARPAVRLASEAEPATQQVLQAGRSQTRCFAALRRWWLQGDRSARRARSGGRGVMRAVRRVVAGAAGRFQTFKAGCWSAWRLSVAAERAGGR
jgi:hypothetical protein